MTIQEVSKRLGKSEATIRRAIKSGTLVATMIDGKYDISEQAYDAYTQDRQMPTGDDQFEFLKEQLKEKDKQIEKLQEQMGQLNQLLAMEKQETLQLMEALPPPRKSFWDKFKRK